MRLTEVRVMAVDAVVKEATGGGGVSWLGGDIGHGNRYVFQDSTIYVAGLGEAAGAISHLVGIAEAYDVDLRTSDAKAGTVTVGEVVDYLYMSGRFDVTARERGVYEGTKRRQRGR